jgi:Acyl-CoA dehydrogenase, C-terminal domain
MIPWAQFRRTYGAPIVTRELVRRRLGELAGLIVACDALVAWCAGLIDRGYRGEMECIIAKIFGSEAQKHAAIEYYMKTHGGRSFLMGHNFGDNIHEYLAPCIYEGEGEMLGMGFFKSLVKHHGKTYFEPIGKALAAAGIRKPNPLNPSHMWMLKDVALPYLKWVMGRRLRPVATAQLPEMPKALREHAEFACERLQRMGLEISSTMSRFQLKLADRQCRMAELSLRCQDVITILTTSMYGARHNDLLVQDAADIFCQSVRQKLLGRRPSNNYFRRVAELGAAIADGQFRSIAGVEADEILMPYEQ